MAKHTALPWKTSKVLGCKEIRGNKVGKHRQAQYKTGVAYTPGLWDEEEDLANAEFIVEACNNHYKLVDLLETARIDVVDSWGILGLEIPDDDPLNKLIQNIDNVLLNLKFRRE